MILAQGGLIGHTWDTSNVATSRLHNDCLQAVRRVREMKVKTISNRSSVCTDPFSTLCCVNGRTAGQEAQHYRRRSMMNKCRRERGKICVDQWIVPSTDLPRPMTVIWCRTTLAVAQTMTDTTEGVVLLRDWVWHTVIAFSA